MWKQSDPFLHSKLEASWAYKSSYVNQSISENNKQIQWSSEIVNGNAWSPLHPQPKQTLPCVSCWKRLQAANTWAHVTSCWALLRHRCRSNSTFTVAENILVPPKQAACGFSTLNQIAIQALGAPLFRIQCDSVSHRQQLSFFLSPSVLSLFSPCQKSIELNEQNWAAP